MIRVKTKVIDKGDVGFKRLFSEIGGLASISLGVQGEEATKPHTNSELPVGAVAAVHELGLSGGHRTRRSWLSRFMDENKEQMISDAKYAMQLVIKGAKRRKVFEKLGYRWVMLLRKNIDTGGVKPPLKPSTVERKGHAIPILESGDVRDAITYRVRLPRLKGGEGQASYAAALAAAAHPLDGVLVKGSPQPPKGGRRAVVKRKIIKVGDAKNRSRAAYAKTLKMPSRGGKMALAKTMRVKTPKAPKAPRGARAGGGRARRTSAGGGGRLRTGGRSWALRWLLKVARKALRSFKTHGKGDFRNHGYTGVRKGGGRTGFRGR